jgi:hypothetical protein
MVNQLQVGREYRWLRPGSKNLITVIVEKVDSDVTIRLKKNGSIRYTRKQDLYDKQRNRKNLGLPTRTIQLTIRNAADPFGLMCVAG